VGSFALDKTTEDFVQTEATKFFARVTSEITSRTSRSLNSAAIASYLKYREQPESAARVFSSFITANPRQYGTQLNWLIGSLPRRFLGVWSDKVLTPPVRL
jgi:hypothetical protein